MDVFYINLASQQDRRQAVERDFAAGDTARWRLTRIEAVTAAVAAQTPGAARDGEKACLLSHARALEESLRVDGHVLIAEDDIRFGRHTAAAVEEALAIIPDHAWDILFTDVILPGFDRMFQLFRLRQDYDANGHAGLLDLGDMNFAGSIGYIVNRNARHKLLAAIAQNRPIDAPYDVWLKQLVHGGVLRAFVTFPFATTQSDLGAASQIQASSQKDIRAIWTAYRQLTWRERDIGQALASLARANETAAPDADAMGKIFALMFSPEFKDR